MSFNRLFFCEIELESVIDLLKMNFNRLFFSEMELESVISQFYDQKRSFTLEKLQFPGKHSTSTLQTPFLTITHISHVQNLKQMS